MSCLKSDLRTVLILKVVPLIYVVCPPRLDWSSCNLFFAPVFAVLVSQVTISMSIRMYPNLLVSGFTTNRALKNIWPLADFFKTQMPGVRLCRAEASKNRPGCSDIPDGITDLEHKSSQKIFAPLPRLSIYKNLPQQERHERESIGANKLECNFRFAEMESRSWAFVIL